MSGPVGIETTRSECYDPTRHHLRGTCIPCKSGDRKGKLEILNELASSRNYTIQQVNGQRTYGGPPPNWMGPPPPKGCEVFVGNVPRDVFEDEVVPIFETAGKIYELRMMLDFSGTNRGYFFVRYSSREEAIRAIRCFDGYEIRPGKPIGVKVSADNRKLFVSGLPPNVASESIVSELDQLIVGVLDVKVFAVSQSKACCIVEFETHRAAAQARRTLVPQKHVIAGNVVQIEWAKVHSEDNEERSLFVRRFTPGVYRDTLWRLFASLSNDQVEGVRMFKSVAIINFSTRPGAERALRAANILIARGAINFQVTWANPRRVLNSSGDEERSPSNPSRHLNLHGVPVGGMNGRDTRYPPNLVSTGNNANYTQGSGDNASCLELLAEAIGRLQI